jgi:uncharacterized lipoprotein
MVKNIVALSMALGLLFSAAGCTTLADVRAAKGSGQSRVYDAPFERVWDTVPEVLKELGLKEEGNNKAAGYVVAQRPIELVRGTALARPDENVAIFVEKVNGAPKTRVEVVSKKAVVINVFAKNWETRILDKLAEDLRK